MQQNNQYTSNSYYYKDSPYQSYTSYPPTSYISNGVTTPYQSDAGSIKPQITVANSYYTSSPYTNANNEYTTNSNVSYAATTPRASYVSKFGNSTNPIHSALDNLGNRIYNLLQKGGQDSLQSAILNQALQTLSNVQNEAKEDALLLDLYLTMNSIYLICGQKEFSKDLKNFFLQRENLLRGDSHDYFYSQSLANQFCVAVAKIVFPQTSPYNTLLHYALTSDRQKPWEDVATLENEILDVTQYFRTYDNCIHSYESVLECAATILKRGYFEVGEIWHGSDVKNLRGLSRDTLGILKQRSQSLGNLIDYTESLEGNAGYITKIFAEWRKGLADGRSGDEAKKPAYIANKEFFTWWNDLQKTEEGKLIQSKLSDISELKEFIDELSSKLSVGKCVDGYQARLERILGNHRHAISQIENICFDSISNTELDRIKSQVQRELAAFRDIHTNRNVFADLKNKQDFMTRFARSYLTMNYKSITPMPDAPKPKPKADRFGDSYSESLFSPKKVEQVAPVPMSPPVERPQQSYYPSPNYQSGQQKAQPSVQKHGLFKHWRQQREEKKIQKKMEKHYRR